MPKKTTTEKASEDLLYECRCAFTLSSIQHLLNKGARVNFLGEQGETALYNAVFRSGHDDQRLRELLELLVAHGAKLDVRDHDNGETPLHRFVIRNQVKCIDLFIQKDAYLDIRDNAGNSPLHVGAEQGQLEALALLLETGQMDIDAKNRDGMRPLSMAANAIGKSYLSEDRVRACVRLLLGYGANGELALQGRTFSEGAREFLKVEHERYELGQVESEGTDAEAELSLVF